MEVLPSYHWYAFLEESNTLPLIIAAYFLKWRVKLLLNLLVRYIKSMGWIITNIVGIPPGICTHKIQLCSKCKLSVKRQKRFNPSMQNLVKKEIIKLLDACVIYPIADIKWVSPIQTYKKKGRHHSCPKWKEGASLYDIVNLMASMLRLSEVEPFMGKILDRL